MVELFIISLLIGVIAGILAGLFGLGGGVVIVPALVWLFSEQHYPEQYIMIMAVATSLATIIFTSISSLLSHQFLGNIVWGRVVRLCPGILFGAGIGAIFAEMLSGEILRWVFISYLFYVGFRMLVSTSPAKNNSKQKKIDHWLDYLVGNGIGWFSALLGIGGGTLTVPYLVSRQVPMKNAVAVSSVCGLPIAISGTLVYIYLGWNKVFLPEWNFGYINLPTWGGIIICSILTAPIGAKLAATLPAVQLKRYFSIVIFSIAIKMIVG